MSAPRVALHSPPHADAPHQPQPGLRPESHAHPALKVVTVSSAASPETSSAGAPSESLGDNMGGARVSGGKSLTPFHSEEPLPSPPAPLTPLSVLQVGCGAPAWPPSSPGVQSSTRCGRVGARCRGRSLHTVHMPGCPVGLWPTVTHLHTFTELVPQAPLQTLHPHPCLEPQGRVQGSCAPAGGVTGASSCGRSSHSPCLPAQGWGPHGSGPSQPLPACPFSSCPSRQPGLASVP